MLAYLYIVCTGALGGILVAALGGINYHRIHIKPILTKVVIPPLLGMIVVGCLVRNFGGHIAQPFNDGAAGVIRSVCFCILLLRAGLNVSFEGKGLAVLLLAVIP